MDSTIQLIQVTPDQLLEKLTACIEQQFKNLKDDLKPNSAEDYLTRKEAAKLLKINLSTLHAWVNKGLLKPLGISGKVYFKRSELEKSLIPLK